MIFYFIDYKNVVKFPFDLRLSTNGILIFEMVGVEVNITYMARLVNLAERCHDIYHKNTY
jgi:hypothetical protein